MSTQTYYLVIPTVSSKTVVSGTLDDFNRHLGTNFTNPRSQGRPRFQSGERLMNSVGKINAYYSL